jgi:hypothetical protein
MDLMRPDIYCRPTDGTPTERKTMRLHFLITCCAVLLSLLLVAPVRADIDGFKEMKWGATLPEIQRTRKLVLTKDNGPNGSSLYALQDEDLHFGGAVLTGIHCSFSQNRLQGVILLFQGVMDFAAMRSEAFSQFGETKRYGQDGEEVYNWVGELTSIVLSFNRDSQSGILFLKSKKPLEQLRYLEKETEQETALDRAPPVVPRREQAPDATTPEILNLISRDQELTRLCWGAIGPKAEAACDQMREGVIRLEALGMCNTPGDPGGVGPETHWYQCNPQVGMKSDDNGKEALCRQIEELFTTAARMRDNDVSPQIAEEELLLQQGTGGRPEITKERIRETVELVYFDPNFTSSWGQQLQHRVHDSCLNGKGPYSLPLKFK